MALCFPLDFLPIEIHTVNNQGLSVESPSASWLIFTEEVHEIMQEVLLKFNYDSNSLFAAIESKCRFSFKRMPWAVVFYRDEYPLAGHMMSIRNNPDDIKFSSYSLARDKVSSFDPSADAIPPLSFLWIFSKESLHQAALSGSHLLEDVWKSLSDKSIEKSWVVISEKLDPSWVNKVKAASEKQFFDNLTRS